VGENAGQRKIESLRQHVPERQQHAQGDLKEVKPLYSQKGQESHRTSDRLQDAEKPLHGREQLLAQIVQTNVDATLAFDDRGSLLVFNPAAEKIFGYPAGEAMGQSIKMLMAEPCHGEYEARIADCLPDLSATVIGRNRQLLGRRKDGAVFPLELVISAFTLDGRRTFTAIARDITKRKRAAKHMHSMPTVLADSNDAVTFQDLDGTITAWNRGAERMYGYVQAEALGMNIRSIVPKAKMAEAITYLDRLAGGEAVESFETQRIARGGRVLDVWLTITALKDEAGRPVGIVATERDITDRKRAERQLREDRQQLRRLTSELSLAEDRERRQIAAHLHDQIGGTLAAAKINLGRLQEAEPTTEARQALSEVRGLIETAITSIRSLTFDLAPPILYEVGLEPALEDLADQIQQRHGIRRVFEDDGQPKPLSPELKVVLHHAVQELLVNVAKHAQASSVHVSIRRDGANVRIRVEDDGVGFEPPENGFRVSRSGGFGLFHVGERLRHLGSRLDIESQPGRGTTVTVVAPLAVASPAHEPTAS
jgi:PAS domain S-box-containing protein